MGIIQKIREKNIDRKPLRGYRLGFCLHITKETSVLLMAARDLGAEIAPCSANPLSTQDDILHFSLGKVCPYMPGADKMIKSSKIV